MGTAANSILNRVSEETDELIQYVEVVNFADGSAMSDTKCDGVAYRKKGSKYYKLVSDTYNVREFGAVGDGIADDTAAFNLAIQSSYKNRKPYGLFGGWKNNITIKIPPGKYKITDTLNTAGLPFSRFKIEGDSYNNTSIIFAPTSEKWLLDNNQQFGFSTFQNFEIYFGTNAKFLNLVGGGSAAAQGIVFNNVRFHNPKTVIEATGNSMSSEVTFRDCRIIGGNTNQELFILSNPQAVNWRFFGTDIESFTGTLIQFKGGGGLINFYHGSIISDNGKIIHVPADASESGFGTANAPHASFFGAKFELHGNTKLVHIEHASVQLYLNWYSCGMGMFNLTPGYEFFTIKGMGAFNFNSCYGWGSFVARHSINGSEVIPNTGYYPAKITFTNSGPAVEGISGVCEGIDNPDWNASGPTYQWIGFAGDRSIKIFNKSDISGPYKDTVKEKLIAPLDTYRQFVNISSGTGTYVINTPSGEYVWDARVIILPKWAGGYGDTSFTVNVYADEAKTILLGTKAYNSNNGVVIKLNEDAPWGLSGKIVLELSVVINPGWTTFGFTPLFTYKN